jgi:hypothetical protein
VTGVTDPDEVLPSPVVQAMQAAVAHTAAGRSVAKADALEVLFDHSMDAVYAACAAWAEVVRLFTGLDEGNEFTELEIVDRRSGARMDPREADEFEQPRIWAGQFLATHVNGDRASRLALFNVAAADPAVCARNVLALLDVAGAAVRSQMPGGGDPHAT